MQKEQCIDFIQEDIKENNEGEKDKRYQGVHIFPTREDGIDRFTLGTCLSCLFLINYCKQRIFAPYSIGRSTCFLVWFEYSVEGFTNLCGLNCATFCLAKQTGKTKEIQKSLIGVSRKGIASEYGLMLPHRSGLSKKFEYMFSVVTHTWMVLSKNRKICEACLCNTLF